MIPHKLHLIWMGDRPVPKWEEMWFTMYTHWDVRLWNEKAIRALPLVNKDVFDWYAERGRWNGAADVARAEILNSHGGVYTDIDSIPLRLFDYASFMEADLFVGLTRQRDRVANGTIGAVAGHPVLQTYIALIGKTKKRLPPSRTIGSTLLTRALGCHAGTAGIVVLPPRVLYPTSLRGQPVEGDETPYVEHLWAGTRGAY